MQRIIQLPIAVCLFLLASGCPMESGYEHQAEPVQQTTVQQPSTRQQSEASGSILADELGRQAEKIAAESAEEPITTEPEADIERAEPDIDTAESEALDETAIEAADEGADQAPESTEQDLTEEEIEADEQEEAVAEEELLPELETEFEPDQAEPSREAAADSPLPQNTGELFEPEEVDSPLEAESGLPQNAGELFELEAALEDCCTPGLSEEALEFAGYWAVVASVNDGETKLKDRNDAYAFELDEKGCLTLHIRLDDGRVLNLAGAWDVKDNSFTIVLEADDAETSYRLGWHSENLRILTARNGTKLYVVRINPAARPARPASSYQSSTFSISFTGHGGKYSGTFAEGRGILDVTAIGGFLVGSFSRTQADDGVLNGYVILEIEPDRFIGPYWCENCNDFSADWVGKR